MVVCWLYLKLVKTETMPICNTTGDEVMGEKGRSQIKNYFFFMEKFQLCSCLKSYKHGKEMQNTYMFTYTCNEWYCMDHDWYEST